MNESLSENLEWLLVQNPTVASTALSFSDETNSGFQRAVGITANLVTLGATSLILGGGYITSDSGGGRSTHVQYDVHSTLSLGAQIDGTQDIIALCVRPISGTVAATLEMGMTVRMQM